ncbi:MAG: hypothetical protein K2H63_11055 [Paramuribaculum sp.]|nr:hypothetical protein [Paramuribaculum sp.]
MPAFKLTATQNRGDIPKGFSFQVASSQLGSPKAEDVERAIIAAGFSERTAKQYRAAGNFKVEKL